MSHHTRESDAATGSSHRRGLGAVLAIVVAMLAATLTSLSPADSQTQGIALGVGVPNSSLSATTDLEAQLGRQVDVVRVFATWESGFESQHQTMMTQGRDLLYSIRPTRNDGTQIPWADIATAQPGEPLHDEMVAWGQALAPFEDQIMFSFHHEPEAEVNLPHGNDADFIAAWQHFMQVLSDAGFEPAQRVLILTARAAAIDPGDRRHIDRWYPGDGWVEAVGIDAYNWYDCRAAGEEWRAPLTILEPFRLWSLDHPDEDLMLAEFGTVEDPTQPSRKANWLLAARGLMATPNYSRFTVAAYFDVIDGNHPNCNWRINTSPLAFSAFDALADDPFWGGGGPPLPPIAVIQSDVADAAVLDRFLDGAGDWGWGVNNSHIRVGEGTADGEDLRVLLPFTLAPNVITALANGSNATLQLTLGTVAGAEGGSVDIEMLTPTPTLPVDDPHYEAPAVPVVAGAFNADTPPGLYQFDATDALSAAAANGETTVWFRLQLDSVAPADGTITSYKVAMANASTPSVRPRLLVDDVDPGPPPGPANVTVTVDADVDDGTIFSFTGPTGPFALADGESATFSVDAGTYSITQSDLADWAETLTCDLTDIDGTVDAQVTISVPADATVLCTATNVYDPLSAAPVGFGLTSETLDAGVLDRFLDGAGDWDWGVNNSHIDVGEATVDGQDLRLVVPFELTPQVLESLELGRGLDLEITLSNRTNVTGAAVDLEILDDPIGFSVNASHYAAPATVLATSWLDETSPIGRTSIDVTAAVNARVQAGADQVWFRLSLASPLPANGSETTFRLATANASAGAVRPTLRVTALDPNVQTYSINSALEDELIVDLGNDGTGNSLTGDAWKYATVGERPGDGDHRLPIWLFDLGPDARAALDAPLGVELDFFHFSPVGPNGGELLVSAWFEDGPATLAHRSTAGIVSIPLTVTGQGTETLDLSALASQPGNRLVVRVEHTGVNPDGTEARIVLAMGDNDQGRQPVLRVIG